jgi:hypothetical protein
MDGQIFNKTENPRFGLMADATHGFSHIRVTGYLEKETIHGQR